VSPFARWMMLGSGAVVCEQPPINHPANITDTRPVASFLLL
jgi:hypothetical protein